MNLVIVESPTKAKTIGKFLGKEYSVTSSFGHVRDLPKSVLGVDVENNFEPKYTVPVKAKKTVAELKDKSKKAKETILATDEDREGESISWHLQELLKLKNPKRIVFHEITKSAIENALEHPREIDMNLVNSQQARRVLDRLVGYKLSPFLWKKVMRGLSAGRVQSVAVRLVVEREREIEKFVPVEFWSIIATLNKISNSKSQIPNKSQIQNSNSEFQASLAKKDGKTIDKLEVKNKQEADQILQDLKEAQYKVASVEKKGVKRNPLPPFTTSTLQQYAWAKFKFSAQRTMKLAQDLYERGLITYHRTDSVNLSSQSQNGAKKFIEENFGKDYWPEFARSFKTKSKSAQEAHEAIRPAYPEKKPEDIKEQGEITPSHQKLYGLIWRRFLASQMKEALFNATKVEIEAKNYTFSANGQTLKFDGFLKVWPTKFEEMELPELIQGEILALKDLSNTQHFTQPPARYSEATLIKKLEQEGIGRPSTYAPTLATVQKRKYVEKDENKRLKPTEIGTIVNDLLVEHFPEVVDLKFTATMEEELDEIAEGKHQWQKAVKNFYEPFAKNLAQKETEVIKKNLTEKTDKICPKCQGLIIIRPGRFGKFFACSNFPKCDYTENIPRPSLGILCPKCKQKELVEKPTKKGKLFYGCPSWPKCDFALWDRPNGQTCPICESLMVETKAGKITCSNKECEK